MSTLVPTVVHQFSSTNVSHASNNYSKHKTAELVPMLKMNMLTVWFV